MPDDKLTLMQEAREEALEVILDADRAAKAEILRPAIGRKLPKAERLMAQRAFLSDMALAEAQYDELVARFQLSDKAPIPRRFVNRVVQAAKELTEAEREAKKAEEEDDPLRVLQPDYELDGLERNYGRGRLAHVLGALQRDVREGEYGG